MRPLALEPDTPRVPAPPANSVPSQSVHAPRALILQQVEERVGIRCVIGGGARPVRLPRQVWQRGCLRRGGGRAVLPVHFEQPTPLPSRVSAVSSALPREGPARLSAPRASGWGTVASAPASSCRSYPFPGLVSRPRVPVPGIKPLGRSPERGRAAAAARRVTKAPLVTPRRRGTCPSPCAKGDGSASPTVLARRR